MFSFFLDPAVRPFSIATAVLFGLALIEMATLLMGTSASDGIEGGVGLGHDDPGFLASTMTWLNLGRVPLLVLLIIGLAAFAIIGFAIQSAALHSLGFLPVWPAALLAALSSLPVMRRLSLVVARIVPRDESYAISEAELIGRTAIVTVGPVSEASVARAKLQDRSGNWHFPRVAPARGGDVIEEGATVLIVEARGRELLVVRADQRLSQLQA